MLSSYILHSFHILSGNCCYYMKLLSAMKNQFMGIRKSVLHCKSSDPCCRGHRANKKIHFALYSQLIEGDSKTVARINRRRQIPCQRCSKLLLGLWTHHRRNSSIFKHPSGVSTLHQDFQTCRWVSKASRNNYKIAGFGTISGGNITVLRKSN